MSGKFDDFFLMSNDDIKEYILEKQIFFHENCSLEVVEIGDGNINYVYRVIDMYTKKSIIVKQASNEARISEYLKISRNRGQRETRILQLYKSMIPSFVPEVYEYDQKMCTIIMEDIIHHTIMRKGLINFKIYPNFSEQISTFLARTLLLTSDIVMSSKKKKKMMSQFINADLCDVTENLVLTEPYYDNNHQNIISNEIRGFVQTEIYDNHELQLEVSTLKYKFMNESQALLHGDFHTGAIFINENHLYVFDPEFAFFGPMGYDIGNIIAHCIFSWCYATFKTLEDGTDNEIFRDWIYESISNIIDLFKQKFAYIYDENVSNESAKVCGFKERYLQNIIQDTAGFAGTECIRRVVGMAKVEELCLIKNKRIKLLMEKTILQIGIKLIMERKKIMKGSDYKKLLIFFKNKYIYT